MEPIRTGSAVVSGRALRSGLIARPDRGETRLRDRQWSRGAIGSTGNTCWRLRAATQGRLATAGAGRPANRRAPGTDAAPAASTSRSATRGRSCRCRAAAAARTRPAAPGPARRRAQPFALLRVFETVVDRIDVDRQAGARAGGSTSGSSNAAIDVFRIQPSRARGSRAKALRVDRRHSRVASGSRQRLRVAPQRHAIRAPVTTQAQRGSGSPGYHLPWP